MCRSPAGAHVDDKQGIKIGRALRSRSTTLTSCQRALTVWLPPPPHPVCAVTGMKAKYRDPKTGKHYATLAASTDPGRAASHFKGPICEHV